MYLVYNICDGGDVMKLLRTKIWNWWDISILKWSCFLFGIAAGTYFHACLVQYVWVILIAAVLLVVRPTIVYFKD
jgi:hypothetical protein